MNMGGVAVLSCSWPLGNVLMYMERIGNMIHDVHVQSKKLPLMEYMFLTVDPMDSSTYELIIVMPVIVMKSLSYPS